MAASQNLPPLGDLPLDRFCNYVWWWATRNMQDETEIDKFRGKLWMPPPTYEGPITEGPWSAEAESAAFASLKAQLSQ